jgi:hypothetical protein
MAKRQDDFDDNEGFFESLMNRRDTVPMPDSMARMFKTVVALLVLFVIALVSWAVWPNGKSKTSAEAVPLIQADNSAYKVKPDEPGGMPIPNKDSTVFETMGTGRDGPKHAENLLEDNEKPMKKEDAFDKDDSSPATVTVDHSKDDPKVEYLVSSGDKESATATTVTTPVDPINTVGAVKPALPASALPTPKPVVAPSVPKKTDIITALKEEAGSPVYKPGTSYIQLAAVKSEGDAKTKWVKLQGMYPALKPMSLHVQKADLGVKGVFYRVQAGPVSAADAGAVCTKIKSAKGDCIVVK